MSSVCQVDGTRLNRATRCVRHRPDRDRDLSEYVALLMSTRMGEAAIAYISLVINETKLDCGVESLWNIPSESFAF